MFFRMAYKSGPIFLPFCNKSRVWRTDGQTDRRTEFSSLGRVCIACSAVIKWTICDYPFACCALLITHYLLKYLTVVKNNGLDIEKVNNKQTEKCCIPLFYLYLVTGIIFGLKCELACARLLSRPYGLFVTWTFRFICCGRLSWLPPGTELAFRDARYRTGDNTSRLEYV